MKYKNIYVLLLIVAGSSVYAAEQSMQQEQMPRELIFELFVKDLPGYTNQEALNALKALRQTNKSFANDQGLQQAIHYMKNFNSLNPHFSNRKLYPRQLTLIATLLRAQEWLRNNTLEVIFLVSDIISQRFDRPRELPLLNMLEILWPLSSRNFDDSIYESLANQLHFSRERFVDISCETAKFLHKKNIPLNNQKTGYCQALQFIIEVIKSTIRPPDPKMIEDYKILYKCLKDLGARLDPKYQEEAKELGLE